MKWSPYSTQDQLFDQVIFVILFSFFINPYFFIVSYSFQMMQFDHLEEQGTRIVIYNLWDDDEGKLELDFDTDPHVIYH